MKTKFQIMKSLNNSILPQTHIYCQQECFYFYNQKNVQVLILLGGGGSVSVMGFSLYPVGSDALYQSIVSELS